MAQGQFTTVPEDAGQMRDVVSKAANLIDEIADKMVGDDSLNQSKSDSTGSFS